jgi:hypothetical protein
MHRLNGWQRIGIVLSALWCLVVTTVTVKTYYDYFQQVAIEATIAECRKNARNSPFPEKNERACGISIAEAFGDGETASPQLLHYFSLLLFPLTVSWLVVYATVWLTRWVREGFKIKSSPVDSNLPEIRPFEPSSQPQKRISKVRRCIIRAWSGDERLWKVFWLYNVLGFILLTILSGLLANAISPINSFIGRAIIVVFIGVYLVLYIVYYVWAVCSLWRCAFNVKGKWWGYLSRAYVLMFVLALLGIMVALIIPLIQK